ncbi:MAG TPA: SPOR domain-containing protein [Gaiellaceae bacterium]|nr:SPOR domain-containing protein [Gaiellaceae bacterium]HYA08189.1 SPOR domain-containing protein [Gaiellaceae bacterium]
MSDDYRIRIEPSGEQHAEAIASRLQHGLGSDEAKRLARELEGRRLAVSRDDNELFVYTSSPAEAEQARQIVQAELAEEGIEARVSDVESWLHDEERWSDEPPQETWEEEEIEHGNAPWEVRVEFESHADAKRQADELEGEGYKVVRRYRFLVVGTASEEEARALAERLHGSAEPGGELVWEVARDNPFAVFSIMGGSGTPI